MVLVPGSRGSAGSRGSGSRFWVPVPNRGNLGLESQAPWEPRAPREPRLRIADSRVLREEEAREERIDAHQSCSRQLDAIRVRAREVPFTGQRPELILELSEDVSAVLTLKVRRCDLPQLQLQNQLAAHALLRGRTIGAAERELAAI